MTSRIEPQPKEELLDTVAYPRGDEWYVLMWPHGGNVGHLLRTLGRWASDPELSFTWRDASVVSKKVWDYAHTKD